MSQQITRFSKYLLEEEIRWLPNPFDMLNLPDRVQQLDSVNPECIRHAARVLRECIELRAQQVELLDGLYDYLRDGGWTDTELSAAGLNLASLYRYQGLD